MSRILNEKQVAILHKKYAKGQHADKYFELLWTHSQIVKEISLAIVKGLKKKNILVNVDLVIAGALLHDIGVYQCKDEDLYTTKAAKPYITHGEIGARILKKEGISVELQRFPIIHTGVGISKEDIIQGKLPIRLGDYIPITLEEEIVTYADKFHTKSPEFVTYEKAYQKLVKINPEKGVIFERYKKKFKIPDLNPLIRKYRKWHLEFNNFIESLQSS